MIPDSIVEEVRVRADIVELIGEQIPLKRAGKDFRALCPFHNEKTPSFYVVPAKGFYKCFGCGESGDVFTFLMKRQGLTFLDAVRQIAARVGVEIPESTREVREEPHRALYEAVAFAADHFRRQLWEEDAGAAARAYLENRGIPREAADRFGIGYAPAEWRLLRESAHRHGITDEVLEEAGLIKRSEKSEEPYDRFRDRLMFPTADVTGRVIAFGGRLVGRAATNAPKYLNSPDTPIYHKGEQLYGLNWSKGAIRREGAALVVEGYMDYVSLAARGIENVVAGLGTAMTAEQANLLARYAGRAYLLYDSDTAGLRATFRTADALLRANVHPLVVSLPQGEDPDSLVRKGGADALRPHLDAAVDVLERKLQILDEHEYFRGIEGSRRALDRLLPTLRAVVDPALRDIYIARIAERTGVRRETLEREARATGPARPAPPVDAPVRRPPPAVTMRERLLLMLLLRDPALVPHAVERVPPDHVHDPVNREIFLSLTGGLEGSLGREAASRLEALRQDPEEITDARQSFENVVADLALVGHLFAELADLNARLAVAPDADAEALVRRRVELQAQLAQTGLGFKASPRYRRHLAGGRSRERGPLKEDG